MAESLYVVIVDDEAIQRQHMEDLLQQGGQTLGLDIRVDSYASGEAFLFALEGPPHWQLAFLDIEMVDLTGRPRPDTTSRGKKPGGVSA